MNKSMFVDLEDNINSNRHSTLNVKGIQIDKNITDIVHHFMSAGGVSYCSCQGQLDVSRIELLLFDPIDIRNTDQHLIYDYGDDYQLYLDKPFIIIHKNSLPILKETCARLECTIDKIIIGDGGYECPWVKNGVKTKSMRFVVLKLNVNP